MLNYLTALKTSQVLYLRLLSDIINYGKESLEKLRKIETMLANGVGAGAANRVEPVQKDEIDDAFDDLVV